MELQFDDDRKPLAARMRPRTLAEFFGQEQIIGPGRLLRRAIEADQLSSIILSGPPGTGKTTLARIIAARTQSLFLTINAVLSGVKDIREAIVEAKNYRSQTNRRTILFVDEVHRWNKSQQDALLPWVEDGLFVLIGATTENPFFEVNRALLSRSRVFLLSPLTADDLNRIIDTVLADRERGYGDHTVTITDEAREHLVRTAAGDARTLLNALELAVETGGETFPPAQGTAITVDLAVAEDSIQKRAILYDKDGDYHFDTISAFIKSVRGSDPDAALYWLARMIEAGEDPHYIFRRLLVAASEDVGLADPNAVSVVLSCADAFDRIGLPEGRFHLAQATLYLANTEKSNSTLGLFDAIAALREAPSAEVPDHLRDANRDGADLGHGAGYLYPHAYTDHWVAQRYLPHELRDAVYYHPGSLGWEGSRVDLIRERRLLQLELDESENESVWSVAPRRSADKRWLTRLSTSAGESERFHTEALSGLTIRENDRVLLHGTAVGGFIVPVGRIVSSGILSVWTTPRSVAAIRHALGEAADRVDAPQVSSLSDTHADDAERYTGPFDIVLHREFATTEPTLLLDDLLALAAPESTVRVLDIDPSRGDRPSSLLTTLPDDLRNQLVEIESELFPSRTAAWERALHATGSESTHLETFDLRVSRTIDPSVVTAWLSDAEPLGELLVQRLESSAVAAIRNAAATVTAGEYTWRRSVVVATVRSGSALTKSS